MWKLLGLNGISAQIWRHRLNHRLSESCNAPLSERLNHQDCRIDSQMPPFGIHLADHKSNPSAHAFLVEPPAPNRAKMTVTKTTIITTLAVSPWRVPTPRSQYQWMPTLGGSPAKAGNGTAAAAAAAATAVGTCVLLEMNAGTQAQMARRASRTTLSSCDPLRAMVALFMC